MNTIPIRTAGEIAVGGMRANTIRMRAIASNIANVNTTRTPAGTPYRRMDVVISTAGGLTGVKNVQVEPDMTTDFVKVRQPGHPDADADGFVSMPNVQLPTEMMDLVTASRAYQAGAAMLKKHGEVMDVAMELLR
jgi:flagellar basal-body rod protein FlgC